jgi:hypothetical protein
MEDFNLNKYLYNNPLFKESKLGSGGSKEVFQSPDDPNKVIKKFTTTVDKTNLKKEQQLSKKYPEYIALISDLDFKKGTLTQEKLNSKKLKTDIILSLSSDGQDLFDESGLDDEFEFAVRYPQYIIKPDLKNKIEKLNNFVQTKIIPTTGENIDYPNINNVGYDQSGNIKLIEIFY